MPNAQPPDASGTNGEVPGTPPDFFPPVGNFNAVVPLSEIGTDSDSHANAPAPSQAPASPSVRASAEESARDEQEEATLIPARAARTAPATFSPTTFRPATSSPATRRPSWPVMITALALSLAAGLAAGVYLIKSVKPVEIQSPASATEEAPREAAAEATDSRPAQVASESHTEAKPQSETSLDAVASNVVNEASAEKTNRDLPAPKRATAADAPSGRGERAPEAPPSKAAVAERTPERPARKAAPPTADAPAPREAVRTRRATSVAERPNVPRAPERSLPVSSPPPSAKSKRVIQWP